jgi:hypothetical protein
MAKEITSLLLNFNGSNNSTTFIDELGQTITPYGDVKISTTQYKFGGSSAYFDGTGDYLEVTKSNNNKAWDFSTTDWTLECWVYPLDTNERSIFVPRIGVYSTFIIFTSGGKFAGYASSGSNWSVSITGSTTFSINQWYHLAFVRYGNLFILFVNGQVDGTGVYSGSLMSLIQPLIIGKDSISNYANWYGYIDSFKLTNERALYTESFTPPTVEPQYDPYYEHNVLLLPFNGPNNSTVFGDYSKNRNTVTPNGDVKISTTQYKFGGSSVYFDGTGDYLSVQDLTFNGNMTISCWIYITDLSPVSNCICSSRLVNNGDLNYFSLYVTSNGTLSFQTRNSAGTQFFASSTSGSISINQWYHIAVTRISGQLRAFINGNLCTNQSDNDSNFLFLENTLAIGLFNFSSSVRYFNGYMNDFRIISEGIWTSSFTPPDKALYVPYNYDPFLDNVTFLCHMNGDNNGTTFVDSSTNKSTITPYGNAKTVTTQSKIGGSSAYFDGALDALHSTINLNSVIDLTIECWIYLINGGHGNNWSRIFHIGDGNIQGSISLSTIGSDNPSKLKLSLWNPTDVISNFDTDNVITNSTWTHIAIVKKANVWRLFIDGVQQTSSLSTSFTITGTSLNIGGNYTNGESLLGHINNFRITSNVARYTTNFTPPSQRFYDLLTEIEYFYGTYSDFLRVSPGETLGISNTADKQYPVPFRDMEDGGSTTISGYVTYNGYPAFRKVQLLSLQNSRVIRETWSDPITGYYEFILLKDQPYCVIGFDYLKNLSPVVHLVETQTNIAFTDQVGFDPEDFEGNGSIWGTVKDSNQNPLSRRVVLLDYLTYIKVKVTQSDPITGYYEFTDLDTSKYFSVITEDDQIPPNFNDIIRAKCQAS